LDHVDLVWVTSKIIWFRETLKNANDNEPQEGVKKFINFRGIIWVLRLIHALSDNDDARLAFATVFNVKDRQALDSRNSPGHVVKTVYDIIADYYNDETFNPWSTAYPRVHSEFAVPIDLTYESVKKFGDITPQKVKDKLAELRCRLNIMKINYDKSGQGEGGMNPGTNDNQDDYVPGGANDDRQNFLGQNPPTVLYLWEKLDHHDMYHTLMQKLDGDVALDGDTGAVPSILTPPSSGKRKRKSDSTNEDFENLMAEEIKFSRKAMQNFNLAQMQDKVDEAEDNLQEALDSKEELESGGHYSGAVMRRCKRKIDVCRRRYDERLKSLEEQKKDM